MFVTMMLVTVTIIGLWEIRKDNVIKFLTIILAILHFGKWHLPVKMNNYIQTTQGIYICKYMYAGPTTMVKVFFIIIRIFFIKYTKPITLHLYIRE